MEWSRARGVQFSAHFHSKELECACGMCSKQFINDHFLEMLEEVRGLFGAPIKVTSAYRCALRQDQLRKQGYETATGISSHQLGIAADITANDMVALGKAVNNVFAKHSIGTAKSFIHIDTRPGGPRRWLYLKT